jgi:hypothetical protein
VITPTVHLNGTAGDVLLSQVEGAGAALRKALNAIEDAGPNGRDYYPQGPNAIETARREHASRVERVRAVLDEFEAMHEAIVRAIDARSA